MAVLNVANIPNGINSYERLACWAIQCLQSISNGQDVNVAPGADGQPIASASLVVTADGVPRWALVAYPPADLAALNSSTAKTWMATNDIATAAPHVNLLSN